MNRAVPFLRAPLRRCATVAACAVALTGAGVGLTPATASAATAVQATPLAIGTFDTDLQPWLPGQATVLDTIASTNLDVLGLQGCGATRPRTRS